MHGPTAAGEALSSSPPRATSSLASAMFWGGVGGGLKSGICVRKVSVRCVCSDEDSFNGVWEVQVAWHEAVGS